MDLYLTVLQTRCPSFRGVEGKLFITIKNSTSRYKVYSFLAALHRFCRETDLLFYTAKHLSPNTLFKARLLNKDNALLKLKYSPWIKYSNNCSKTNNLSWVLIGYFQIHHHTASEQQLSLFTTAKSNFKQSPHSSFTQRSNSPLHRKDGIVISTINLDSETWVQFSALPRAPQ